MGVQGPGNLPSVQSLSGSSESAGAIELIASRKIVKVSSVTDMDDGASEEERNQKLRHPKTEWIMRIPKALVVV